MRWGRPPFAWETLALITWRKASPGVSAFSMRSTRVLLPGNDRDCFGIHQKDARTDVWVTGLLAGVHGGIDGRRLCRLLLVPLRPVGRHAVADSRDGKPRRIAGSRQGAVRDRRLTGRSGLRHWQVPERLAGRFSGWQTQFSIWHGRVDPIHYVVQSDGRNSSFYSGVDGQPRRAIHGLGRDGEDHFPLVLLLG